MTSPLLRFGFSLALLTAPACGTDAGTSTTPTDTSAADTTNSDTAGTDDTATPDTAPDSPKPAVCEPSKVPCIDEQVALLPLFGKASTRQVQNQIDGDGFVSSVDAAGGGMNPSEAFVYARFTDKGLEKVAIGDEAAFTSLDWDIAFRRYVIRLNSGVAGPGCVYGAQLAKDTAFQDVASVPVDAEFEPEAYFTTKCTLVPDGSGLEAPDTVTAGFWKYSNCVQMTDFVYLIQRGDGRVVKATVTDYYAPEAQATCNTTGKVPMGTPGGQMRIRWAFLQP
jgi:hypothetical protein